MISKMLITIFTRDLNRLIDELNAYGDESTIWQVQDGISNSAGNLALHLIGNLNHFIGASLGNSGYVRERDKEFSLKNIPRADVLASIDNTIAVVQQTLGKLTDEDLNKPNPYKLLPGDDSIHYFLLHLLAHLNYHLGQINYHRRLIGK